MTLVGKRRWLAFSLRTMFVVVTVFGVAAAWLARTANVVRERDEMIRHTTSASLDDWRPRPISWRIVAFLFGYDKGSYYWDVISAGNRTIEETARLHRVFPEARISTDGTSPHSLPIPEYRKHPPGCW